MTPRQQRLSPQASMDELSASSISTASGETKPLLLDSSSGGEDDSSSSSFSKSWIANKSNTAANSSSSSRTRKSSSSLSSNNNDNRNNNNNNNNNTANREETPVVVEDAQRVLVSEVTRLQHDYFNLVALVRVCMLFWFLIFVWNTKLDSSPFSTKRLTLSMVCVTFVF